MNALPTDIIVDNYFCIRKFDSDLSSEDELEQFMRHVQPIQRIIILMNHARDVLAIGLLIHTKQVIRYLDIGSSVSHSALV